MICAICGTVGKEVSGTIQLFDENDAPITNISDTVIMIPSFSTRHKNLDICDPCMGAHRKIYALLYDENSSCGGVEYWSDGRNLINDG